MAAATSWRLLRAVEHLLLAAAVLRLVALARRKGWKAVVREVLSVGLQHARRVPGLGAVVEAEIGKEVAKIEDKMLGDGDPDANLQLPAEGRPAEGLLASAKKLHDEDDFATGKKWAGIYHEVSDGTALEALQSQMWTLFNNANNLYPGIFKSCRKFEAEIVQMCVDMLHGKDTDACGLLTSGGTESILLAVLGYRELARERGIERPQIITATSAHGALDKACHYFGLDLVKVDADPATLTLTPALVEPLITPATIAVYASAPSFPFGTVDPIEELAALTRPRRLGLHVDNCLGGFYLSGLQAAGIFARPFDFAVDGVTTISIDVHKYGFAPKGVSVVCFASSHLRRLTIHPVTSGLTLYVTPTLQGSRGGGVVAAAWATMMHIGADGYRDYAVRFDALKTKIEQFVHDHVPGLRVAVQADLAIIPFASDEFDIYLLASLLERQGWSTFTSQNPPLMQVCIGEQHFRVIDEWLSALKACAAEARAHPEMKIEGDAAVYGAAQMLPEEVIDHVMRSYVEVKLKVKPTSM